ncbi:MAG: lysophospholipid acyltransferase family protein, partial [Deltaproteobacteria bacterium]|nr:lysophospholipid acyltransferase family protein [Deltaproteobacteria bacterium]
VSFRRPVLNVLQTMQYRIAQFFIWLIRTMPYRPILLFTRSLCLLAWVLDPLHRKTADIQMKHTLGSLYNPLLSLKVFMNHGDIVVDTIRFAYMDEEEIRDRIVVEGKEHLETAHQSNRGIMLVTGHIGNWEILTHLPRILDIDFCVMADIRNDPRFEAIIDDIRSRSGATILPPKGKALMLIRELRKGSTIGMVVDQRGKRGERLFCEVLGLPAPTNPAPAFIAIKGNALILPVYAIKQGDIYHIRFCPAIDTHVFGKGEKAIEALSSHMQSWVASVVLKYPDQWFWLHARWTRRADMRKIVKKNLDFRKEVLRQYEERQHAI